MDNQHSNVGAAKDARRPSKKSLRKERLDPDGGWRVVNPHAAGIDIGSREHYVAVPGPTMDEPQVKSFGCFTPQLYEMAQWLREHGVTTVALEATGVYWIPVIELLESEGFEMVLINSDWKKQIKTDVKDCRALQRLHMFGLLRGSFRPSQEIVALRTYWRQRVHLVTHSSQQILLMQKALEQMNIQLHKAVTDITGMTGMKIIRNILTGGHDPARLAKLRHQSVKTSEADMVKALTGNYRAEHLFSLRQAVEAYDFLQGQIEACDKAVQAQMRALDVPERLCPPQPGTQTPTETAGRRKNQPYVDLRAEQVRLLGVDLTEIPGLSVLTVQTFLTEVGPELTRKFPSEKHFASWLGLCPNYRKTGGRIHRTRTRRVANRLATALRVSAQALERNQTGLGGFYRRLKGRKGPAKAITATAHRLACIIYRMLAKGQQYVEIGMDYYEQQYRQRVLKNLSRRARALGYDLTSQVTGEVVS